MAYIRKNLYIYASMEFLKERKKRERKKKEHAKYPLHKCKHDINYYQIRRKYMIYRIMYYHHSTGLMVTEEFKDINEAISHYNYNLRFGRVWWYEIEEA